MSKQKAFTLIELMIVVTIIGILAAIAYPTYRDSVMKSHRGDAKAALLGLGSAMERQFTKLNWYCDAASGGTAETNCGDSAIGDTGTPSIYTPSASLVNFYTVTISAVTPSSYTLSATPIGAQANDQCGTLTLTQTGVKDNSAGLSQSVCW